MKGTFNKTGYWCFKIDKFKKIVALNNFQLPKQIVARAGKGLQQNVSKVLLTRFKKGIKWQNVMLINLEEGYLKNIIIEYETVCRYKAAVVKLFKSQTLCAKQCSSTKTWISSALL